MLLWLHLEAFHTNRDQQRSHQMLPNFSAAVQRRGHMGSSTEIRRTTLTVLFIPAGVFASVCLGRGAINEPLFARHVCSESKLKCGVHGCATKQTLHQILKHSDEPSSFFFLCTHCHLFLHNGFFLIYSLIRIKANKMRTRESELIFFLDLST